MSARNNPRARSRCARLLDVIGLGLIGSAMACGSSGGGAPQSNGNANVVIKDANNFTSQSTLTIPTVDTAAGADLMVCWDGVKKDLLCHDVMPPSNGIDNVSFLQIPRMTHDQVSAKLAVGNLNVNDVAVYADYARATKTQGSSCTKLSQLLTPAGESLKPDTDFVADANKSYMMLFETGTTPGVGSRTMVFLNPTASSNVMTVNAPDACPASGKILDFNATLGSELTISASDRSKWTVDWSMITKDSFGNPISFGHIDYVLLGFYEGMSKADLQAKFVDIQQIATTLYRADVDGASVRSVNLADATVNGGTDPFPGFTKTDGVWAIAVMCSKCQLPAPVALTILTPQ